MNIVEFPSFSDVNGMLTVFEANKGIPFSIQRVFSVTAPAGSKRGEHAHVRCSQLIVCVSGSVRVSCFDGRVSKELVLTNGQTGVFVPPGIWAVQEYLQENSTIMVFCDRRYEPEDYVRDYQQFLSMKAVQG